MELVISEPGGTPATVALEKDSFSLGRSADNDLAYPNDPWLSRYHLCFERHGDGWQVRDCASRNGTVVNALTLKQPHLLKSGDRVYAGHLTIEVRDPAIELGTNVISFVPPEDDRTRREATIVTSLEKVLGKAAGHTGRYEETLNTARVVQAMVRAGQELTVHRPLEELFHVILDVALSAVEAKRGVILTLENGELFLRASKGEGFMLSTAIRDRVIREKCSLVLRDAQEDDAFRQQKSIVMHQVRSMMAVPLQTGSRVIGLIYVDNAAIVRPFSHEDLDLLTVMANVAAIRIEHARLAVVEQNEKVMESELAQASEMQQSLLPTEAPMFEGYDLAGLNLPCRSVGGDYFDYLSYKDGRVGLVVGDVSGKGMPAAILMSSLQARVQMLLETNPDPATAIGTLNRNIAERLPLGKFITFFYGLLDTNTGVLHYSNAGHNYPLVIHKDGRVEKLLASGMVIGIMPQAQYETREVKLDSGDLLALYSDGVTEARTLGGDEFGEDRLAEFLLTRRSQKCSEIANALVDYVRAWQGMSSFADDFTVVLARRL